MMFNFNRIHKFSFALFILLVAHLNIISAQNSSIADQAYKTGDEFKLKALPDSAIFYYKKAALYYKIEKETVKLMSAYNQLGTLLINKAQFEEARMYFGMADVQGKTLPDTNDLIRATSLTGIGTVYSSVGDFKGSLVFHQRALAIRVLKSGENNADVATSYGNIGNVYLNLKNYDQSIAAHLKAKEIREKLFGAKSVEITQTYYSLGLAYKEKQAYDTSLDYFQKALKNKIDQLGPEHKDLAKYYEAISGVYYLMGNKEQGDIYKGKVNELLK